MQKCLIPPLSLTLSREKRVRKRREFLRVQKYGFRSFGRFLVVVGQLTKDSSGKFGITVPKKIGPSHVRNKIKRRIRHVMRLNQKLFFEKTLVIVARESIAKTSFKELEQDLIEACQRLRFNRPPHRYRHISRSAGFEGSHEHSL